MSYITGHITIVTAIKVIKTKRKEAVKMAKVRPSNSNESVRKIRPALTPEARENQLIALSLDLVEKRLREGTASSQEVTHFLKLGTMKERLEREKLEEENKLLKAKTESIKSQKRSEELFKKAIDAFRSYNGQGDEYEEDIEDY